MFWHREPKYSMADIENILDMAFDRAREMYEEARKMTMVETGMLPQEHLSRDDFLKNLERLKLEGHAGLGRRIAEPAEDPDLTGRDD